MGKEATSGSREGNGYQNVK